ncbi:MAG: 50S ribosomal protein L18 [Nanoarchaeota archaeon]
MVKNKNKNRIFRFNRRIRGLTDYLQRLKLLKSKQTRAVIRASNNNMLVQFVDFAPQGDKILTSVKTNELTKLGYTLNRGNLVGAYLTGLLAGKKLLAKKFKGDVIVDLGLQQSFYGGRLYATVKGIKDSGVNVRVSEDVFPSEERLSGAHLSAKDAAKVIEKVKKSVEAIK